MAETGISSGHELSVEQWNDSAFVEYTDKLVMKPYMGMSSEALIHVKEDLTKKQGDKLHFSLIAQIDGEGVEGDEDMEGNEEEFESYGDTVEVASVKNAVRSKGDDADQRSPYDIKAEFKPQLTTWLAQNTEKKFFQKMSAIGDVLYASATENQKDAWLAANSDRMLFGAAKANNSSNDHSAALLTVDGSTDILSTNVISLAKRYAQMCYPKIRPIKLENGQEWFVMFVHELAARDLKNTDSWKNAQQYARLRGDGNNIFTGALGEWDGVVLIEAPKTLLLSGVGGGGADVAVNSLCGAQALLYAQAALPGGRVTLTEKYFDYGNKYGCQIKTMKGEKKAVFNGKQHGIVTVYTSAVADT